VAIAPFPSRPTGSLLILFPRFNANCGDRGRLNLDFAAPPSGNLKRGFLNPHSVVDPPIALPVINVFTPQKLQ
jgi:hypothetical protein